MNLTFAGIVRDANVRYDAYTVLRMTLGAHSARNVFGRGAVNVPAHESGTRPIASVRPGALVSAGALRIKQRAWSGAAGAAWRLVVARSRLRV